MTVSSQWREHAGVGVLHLSALENAGGCVAFFTGRSGGVSERWAGGLNWSVSVGDAPENVAANRGRTLEIPGLRPDQAVMAGLVHGDRVVAVHGEEPAGPDGVRFVPDCDAVMTDRPGLALIVTAADCVPVLLYDPVKRVAAAVHAGWRGTVAGIAGKTVQAMARQYGCDPAEIRAGIGPSIGPCCYEVDDAVANPLRAHYGEAAGALLLEGRRPGRYQLDLWAANRQDLLQAGVCEVSVSGECTSCSVNRYFSHRAESGTAGRGAAVIALL